MNRLRMPATLGGLAFEPVTDLRDPPEGWPVWQVPARYVAIAHPGLREFLASDLMLLGRLRIPAFAPIVIVIGVAIVPSLLRALGFLPYPGIDTLDVYTGSLAFMAQEFAKEAQTGKWNAYYGSGGGQSIAVIH